MSEKKTYLKFMSAVLIGTSLLSSCTPIKEARQSLIDYRDAICTEASPPIDRLNLSTPPKNGLDTIRGAASSGCFFTFEWDGLDWQEKDREIINIR